MKRIILAGLATLATLVSAAAPARAQVSVRVPFVQVEVGGPGVYVRAPFVRVFVPSARPVLQVVPADQAPIIGEPLPQPREMPDTAPPAPLAPGAIPAPTKEGALKVAPAEATTPAVKTPTLVEFARTFQAKAGTHDVTVLNPVTKQPTTVHFTLPEGSPRRVRVLEHSIQFDYGPRRFVRVEFDDDGAQVVSR